MKKFLMITLALAFLGFFGSSSSLVAEECDSKDAQEQKKQELKEVKEEKKEVIDESKKAKKEVKEESKKEPDHEGHDH